MGDNSGIWDPDTNAWTASSGLGIATAYLGKAVQDGNIVYEVLGVGGGQKRLRSYDCLTDVWTLIDDNTPVDLYGQATALINGKIYMASGTTLSGTDHSNKLTIYDIGTDTWDTTTGADIPVAVQRSRSFVYDDKMYVVGGQGSDGNNVDIIQKYDPSSNSWTVLSVVLPEVRSRHEVQFLDDIVYVYDGDARPVTTDAVNTLWAISIDDLDPSGPSPQPPVITDMERGSMTITFQGGGQTYKVQSSTSPYDFDETTMTWTDEATGLAPGTWQDTAAPTGAGAEKYYRVVGETDASVSETVGLYAVSILNGRNMMSIPFLPFPEGGGAAGTSTFDKIIGDQLTGHAVVKTLSDLIQQWNADTLTWTKIWLKVGTGWIDYDTGGAAMPFVPGRGYWVFRNGHPDTDVVLFGQVAKTDQVITVLASRNILGTPYPVDVALDDSGLVASGFQRPCGCEDSVRPDPVLGRADT